MFSGDFFFVLEGLQVQVSGIRYFLESLDGSH